MKRLILFLMSILPLLIVAQNDCDFFENVAIQIEKTLINTSESDFGPSFVNNELWYSAYTDKEIKKISRGATKNIFYDLFVSPFDMAGNLVGEKKIQFEEISTG